MMTEKTLKVKRLFTSKETGTFSFVYYKDNLVSFIMERPWEDNKPFYSCIPSGTYELVPHNSFKFKLETFALVNKDLGVTHYQDKSIKNNRYAILIHPASFVHNLAGCLAPGFVFSKIEENKEGESTMLSRSRDATKELLALIKKENIKYIDIEWYTSWE
jgi:hypothetical protein